MMSEYVDWYLISSAVLTFIRGEIPFDEWDPMEAGIAVATGRLRPPLHSNISDKVRASHDVLMTGDWYDVIYRTGSTWLSVAGLKYQTIDQVLTKLWKC